MKLRVAVQLASGVLVGMLATVQFGCASDALAPAIICHNSNCATAPDPTRDDTLAALREGLALLEGATPRLDGLELDLLWDGAGQRCLFAHDVPTDGSEPALAKDAAVEVANAVVAPGFATRAGGPLVLYLELKGYVGVDHADVHDADQRVEHARCALAVQQTVAEAAAATGHTLQTVFTSFDPALLVALQQEGAKERADVRLAAILGIPPPLDGQTRSLDAFAEVDLDLVEAHPGWMQTASREVLRSAGVGLSYWMFSAGTDTLARIERDAPEHLVTNEAAFFDQWLRSR